MNRTDIAIFRFLKMATATILIFRIREILLADGVQSVETHHHAKFRQNWSIRCRDIAIFQFFKIRLPSWICLGHIWTTHVEYLWSL